MTSVCAGRVAFSVTYRVPERSEPIAGRPTSPLPHGTGMGCADERSDEYRQYHRNFQLGRDECDHDGSSSREVDAEWRGSGRQHRGDVQDPVTIAGFITRSAGLLGLPWQRQT